MGTVFSSRNLKLLVLGAALGCGYGLLVRASGKGSALLPVMSVSFLFLLPFAIGFLAVFFVERHQAQPAWIWLVLPLVPLTGCIAAMFLLLWEGWICIVMFAPVGAGFAIVGGLLGGWLASRLRKRRTANSILAGVLLLPVIASPLEPHVLASRDIRRVETSIDIRATPEAIWRNIERVPRIDRGELPPSWSHRLGFPNPVEATLSFPGVGGVRHATFEGGVLFIETIDVWEPERRLSFSIAAQTSRIPPTTLDEHVTVGGPYFDVLRGEYRLQPLQDGTVRLHLSSQHRLSTDFNWYASLWTDAVMADLQKRILRVIQARCERAFSPPNPAIQP